MSGFVRYHPRLKHGPEQGPGSEADMARCINKLSARAAATFSRAGRHSDGGNLFLAIDKTGRRRWTFLWRRGGKTHEIGLGSASAVSLARARELASEYRDGLAKVCLGVQL
jgi:hypothetical protein